MQKKRPAIIVQNDIGNIHSGNTVVIPVTHNIKSLPCAVDISPYTDISGNTILDGQANASNIMCVSKARLGDFICCLSTADLKRIDEAIAKSVGLMHYYSEQNKQLCDKLQYISKITEQRNKVQDEISELRNILELPDEVILSEYIKKIKLSVDKR